MDLAVIYGELCSSVDALLADFSGSESISVYFSRRAKHKAAIKKDLLPLLVYEALNGSVDASGMLLVRTWALYLASSHLLDDAQDSQARFYRVNESVMALGLANIALAQLETDEDTRRDILDAVGRVIILGAGAQNQELTHGRIWNRTDYFRSIAAKAAAIIATGAWMGGRLATNDPEMLVMLKEFGLALGMAIQISDDCSDIVDDLTNGIYTLPVIEGLAMTDHREHPTLQQLLSQPVLQRQEADQVKAVLEHMGAIKTCRRLIRAYQVQVEAVFDLLPGLRPYFADYVASKA